MKKVLIMFLILIMIGGIILATRETVKGHCGTSKSVYDVYTKERVDELLASVESGIPTLAFDDVPTENSSNPVKSNGIYTSLREIKETKIDISRISYGTIDPTGGKDGDIYFKYS